MSDQEKDNVLLMQIVKDEMTLETKKLKDYTSHFALLTEKLNRELSSFKNETTGNQEEFQKDVFKQLEGASSQLATRAYEAFSKKTLEESNESIKSLKDLSFKLSGQLSEATKKTKFCFKKLAAFVIAGSVLGGLIGGVIGGAVMRYYPKLDDYVEERYTWGKALERSWKELSKKEQDKIQKLLAKNN